MSLNTLTLVSHYPVPTSETKPPPLLLWMLNMISTIMDNRRSECLI